MKTNLQQQDSLKVDIKPISVGILPVKLFLMRSNEAVEWNIEKTF
jgi:hypothetical protein